MKPIIIDNALPERLAKDIERDLLGDTNVRWTFIPKTVQLKYNQAGEKIYGDTIWDDEYTVDTGQFVHIYSQPNNNNFISTTRKKTEVVSHLYFPHIHAAMFSIVDKIPSNLWRYRNIDSFLRVKANLLMPYPLKDDEYNFAHVDVIKSGIISLTETDEHSVIFSKVDPNKMGLTLQSTVDDVKLSMIYYVNDTDGETVFFDQFLLEGQSKPDSVSVQQKVMPKRNRLVIFDSSQLHASKNPSIGSPPRCIINMVAYDADITDAIMENFPDEK